MNHRVAGVWRLPLAVALAMLSGCAALTEPPPAVPLAPGQPHQAFLASGSDRYVFTLAAPSTVVLESRTAIASIQTVAPDARLVDAAGEVVASDRRSGEGENFRIETHLPAGTWYLQVSNGSGCITLHSCADLDPAYTVSLEVTSPRPR